MIFWTCFSYALTAGYFFLIAFFFVGLLAIIYRTKKSESLAKSSNLNTFSIVIAARNEEHFIGNCLTSITNQNFDKTQFEIIVINDHSSDKTLEVVNQFKIQHSAFKISIINTITWSTYLWRISTHIIVCSVSILFALISFKFFRSLISAFLFSLVFMS